MKIPNVFRELHVSALLQRYRYTTERNYTLLQCGTVYCQNSHNRAMYIIMKHILEWSPGGGPQWPKNLWAMYLGLQDKVNAWWCMPMDGQRKAFLEFSYDLAVVYPLAAQPQYIYCDRWYGQALSCTWTSPAYGHTEHPSHNGCVQRAAGVSRNCFEITWSQCKHNPLPGHLPPRLLQLPPHWFTS